jgi:hypothetical protein
VIRERCVERLAEADALEEYVLGLRVHQALLVQDLLELILLVILDLPLFILIRERCIERLAEDDALEEYVLGL